jgi:hypothetical protein
MSGSGLREHMPPPPYINENRSEMAKLGWHVIVVLVEVAQVHLV